MKMELMCNYCGEKFAPIFGVGEYVKHLIKEHWDILQKLHDSSGEWS